MNFRKSVLWLSISAAFTASASDFDVVSEETSLTVSWQAVENINQYTLRYATSPEGLSEGQTVAVTEPSATLNYLDYDETYYFQVSYIPEEDADPVLIDGIGVGHVPVFASPLIEGIEQVNPEINNTFGTQPIVSDNGRYIYAEYDLAREFDHPGANTEQLFVYDRKLRKFTAASFNDNTEFNGQLSAEKRLDENGNLYFGTQNRNLVSEPDTLFAKGLHRYSPEDGALSLVLADDDGNRLEESIDFFDVSKDGSIIVFQATNIDALPGYPSFRDDFSNHHLFTYHTESQTYTHLTNFGVRSISLDVPQLSPNGRFVAFRTRDNDILQTMIPEDTEYRVRRAIVIIDTQTNERRIATLPWLVDTNSNIEARYFSVHDNGNMIILGNNRIVKYDYAEQTLTQVSDSDAAVASSQTSIFYELATDYNATTSVFGVGRASLDPPAFGEQTSVLDLATGIPSVVSLSLTGEYAESDAEKPFISGSGTYVTFNSAAILDGNAEKRETYTYYVTFADRTDADNDGVADVIDAVPDDPQDWLDTDADGVANYLDDDSDNDGVPDELEAQWGLNPINAKDGAHDIDGDTLTAAQEAQLGTSIFLADTDDDSYPDNNDAFPLDETEWLDTDSDGIGNNADPDDDNDGVLDEDDAFPLDPTESVDTDGDGIGNNADTDDDNDGVLDEDDAFPLDPTESVDTDGDGIGNNADPDDDNDGVLDENDAFPLDPTESADTDGDGIGDNSDPDRDGDGVPNHLDCSPGDVNDATVCGVALFDYDGDGKSDIGVRRAANFFQYIFRSSDVDVGRFQFGRQPTDIPVSGDFDGDGVTDIAVRRPSNFTWYILNSSADRITNNEDRITRLVFGRNAADIPVPADYDGDGVTDIAVWRPSNQTFYIRNSSGTDQVTGHADGITRQVLGESDTFIPVPADYDGDGKTDMAVRDPQTFSWTILNSSAIGNDASAEESITTVNFGRNPNDIPVTGDFDGDGKDDIAVRRPSNQMWYIRNSSGIDPLTNHQDGISRRRFGTQAEDIPVVADYDGDGKADVAVRRPSTQFWYILNSSKMDTLTGYDDGISRRRFGMRATDIPMAAPVQMRMSMVDDVNQ